MYNHVEDSEITERTEADEQEAASNQIILSDQEYITEKTEMIAVESYRIKDHDNFAPAHSYEETQMMAVESNWIKDHEDLTPAHSYEETVNKNYSKDDEMY